MIRWSEQPVSHGLSVSIICEVAQGHDKAEAFIQSLLAQDISPECLEVILVVSGDPNFRGWILDRFDDHPQIQVTFNPSGSRGAGWNTALEIASNPWLLFTSADDRIGPSFLSNMLIDCEETPAIICGRSATLDPFSGEIVHDPELAQRSSILTGYGLLEVAEALPLLTTPFGKLFRADTIQITGPFEESGSPGGIGCWLSRIDFIPGRVAVVDPPDSAPYAHTADGSRYPSYREFLSSSPASVGFQLLEELENVVFDPGVPWRRKELVISDLGTINHILSERYRRAGDAKRDEIRHLVEDTSSLFLNRSLFAEKRAIAFCHNFPPTVDASSITAAKRLAQISELEGSDLEWHVISADMGDARQKDPTFTTTFVDFQCATREQFEHSPWFNERDQHGWGVRAAQHADHRDADVIYSRSMHPGSHVAAYRYKLNHPDCLWYAEFSDPLSTGTSGEPRPRSREYEGPEAFLNTWWGDLEKLVLENADTVIFTNPNQMAYMLDRNCDPELRNGVEAKSLAMGHPLMDPRYAQVDVFDYPLDPDAINIGYFGTFYPERSPAALRSLLTDPRTVLHVFSPSHPELDRMIDDLPGRLMWHAPIPYMQFLSLAIRMDYLYAQDTQYSGPINPYLPSKIADYRSVDRRIIVDIHPGSPLDLSDYRSELLSTEEFIRSLGGANDPWIESLIAAAESSVSPVVPVTIKANPEPAPAAIVDEPAPANVQKAGPPAPVVIAEPRRRNLLRRSLSLLKRLVQSRKEVEKEGTAVPVDPNARSITVIVATYRPCDTLEASVQSVLDQDYPPDLVNILISVNGPDTDWADRLTCRYADEPRIEVIHTPTPGLGAAHNFAIRQVKTNWFITLDDDDYFTPGYLTELAGGAGEDVSVVCGRLIDTSPLTGEVNEDTYINRTLWASKMGRLDHYHQASIASHFSSFTAKLYRTSLFHDRLGEKDELLKQAEDTVFWVENAHLIDGTIFVTSWYSKEAYVRQVFPDSMSRPDETRRFQQEVLDRIALTERFEREVTAPSRSFGHRRFAMDKIVAQIDRIHAYIAEHSTHRERVEIRDAARTSSSDYIAFGRFSDTKGIVVTDAFPSSSDPDAYRSASRLRAVNALHPSGVDWSAITLRRGTSYGSDALYWLFFGRHTVSGVDVIPTPIPIDSNRIESRLLTSLFSKQVPEVLSSIGSELSVHRAAERYKLLYPSVTWIAELSDLSPRDWISIRIQDEGAFPNLLEKLDTAVFNGQESLDTALTFLPTDLARRLESIAAISESPDIPDWYLESVSEVR